MKWELVFLFIITMSYVNALQISEIMYNPNGTDLGREWIEIYSDIEFNITNLLVFDNNGNHITKLIQGNELIKGYAIITSNPANFLSEYDYNGVLLQSSIALPNTQGIIGLRKDNNIFENTTYNNIWGGNGNGRTLEKFQDIWIESETIRGTPGYGYLESHQVPEFTTIGVVVALICILSALVFRRKK
ncbi:MAG: hypothetical protein QXG00_03610 [Candidatus Woesearchaeota archaeon]